MRKCAYYLFIDAYSITSTPSHILSYRHHPLEYYSKYNLTPFRSICTTHDGFSLRNLAWVIACGLTPTSPKPYAYKNTTAGGTGQ